jgi:hypothetical protein
VIARRDARAASGRPVVRRDVPVPTAPPPFRRPCRLQSLFPRRELFHFGGAAAQPAGQRLAAVREVFSQPAEDRVRGALEVGAPLPSAGEGKDLQWQVNPARPRPPVNALSASRPAPSACCRRISRPRRCAPR